MNNSEKKFAQKLCALALTLPAAASVQAEDSWQFSARFDGWFADVNGETALGPDGGNDFDIKLEDVIGSLNFAMLGSFDARKGRWGFVADVFYAEIGDKKTNYREGTPGGSDIPTSAKTSIKFDIKAGALTSAGFYRVIEDGGMTLDVLAGFRYMKIDQKLKWSITGDLGGIELPGREGTLKVDGDVWDAIVGVRGRIPLGQTPWFIPYYLDVGTGDTDFTWQGSTGIGYDMGGWGLALAWRHLSYDLSSGGPINDIAFSGPAAVIEFTW